MKKFLLVCLTFLLIGCGSSNIKTEHGNSKTYLFFKNFDVNKYYVSFWDRNASINDDTKIIMARDNEKYYYEFDGYEKNIIIQKDGKRYDINVDNQEYFVSLKEVEDFSYGILPNDIKKIKDQSYKTGTQKVFGKKYVFEKFTNGTDITTYYFKGNKLIYIKYESIQNTIFLKFDSMKSDFSADIFEISNDFEEITY